MVNGLGVLGYGVGGIEAEAVLLGQPLYQPMPRVIGVRLFGDLPRGSTATDLVLVIANMLRTHGVVGSFVEFAGDGLASLALADRATISNMSPEYGATAALFPIDDETLAYLRQTGRTEEQIALVETYAKENGFWREPGAGPDFDETLELDLGTIEPTVAGPRRPQDKVRLPDLPANFRDAYPRTAERHPVVVAGDEGDAVSLDHGSVAIAAITSCTNTSNPTVMIGAGLLARNAVARGLKVKSTVKTSLAPGSRAVTEYYKARGPARAARAAWLRRRRLRLHDVHRQQRAAWTAEVARRSRPTSWSSRPCCRATATSRAASIRWRVPRTSPRRRWSSRSRWPARSRSTCSASRSARAATASRSSSTEIWPIAGRGSRHDRQGRFAGDLPDASTRPCSTATSSGARCRCRSAAAATTGTRRQPTSRDHRSSTASPGSPHPFGTSRARASWRCWATRSRPTTSHRPGRSRRGARPVSGCRSTASRPSISTRYGARRGHHDVMMRGTFGNIRLRNGLTEKEGPYTAHQPSGDEMFIYDASLRYQREGVPLLIIAGREYGSGSSRDWAAKGTTLLGVRAVLAESYERIHRSNLVGMGVLPMQFKPGQNAASLGLTGREEYDVLGLSQGLAQRQTVTLRVRDEQGRAQHRGHRPARRPGRARLLPPGRHPAGSAEAACRTSQLTRR